MIYDFDTCPDRRETNSEKWDKYPADVLPLWVADMDFVAPEPVQRALRERVVQGVFGYTHEPAGAWRQIELIEVLAIPALFVDAELNMQPHSRIEVGWVTILIGEQIGLIVDFDHVD